MRSATKSTDAAKYATAVAPKNSFASCRVTSVIVQRPPRKRQLASLSRSEILRQEPREQVFLALAGAADWTPDPAWLDVIRGFAEEHRRLHDLRPELLEVVAGLHAPEEIMRVAAAAHFAEHVDALGQLVFAALGRERQLTVLHIRRPVDHPLVEPGLGEEDAVFHARRNPKGY